MIKEADRMGGKILRVQMLGKFTMRYGEDHIFLLRKAGSRQLSLEPVTQIVQVFIAVACVSPLAPPIEKIHNLAFCNSLLSG